MLLDSLVELSILSRCHDLPNFYCRIFVDNYVCFALIPCIWVAVLSLSYFSANANVYIYAMLFLAR
jgi:hypothetical protein